jgi:glycosyltransferase involved in cell wall biosynthesis
LDRHVADHVRRSRQTTDLDVIYGYEDGCLETFKAARERGVDCIYDLPIAYWETSQTLLGEEAERLPEWEPTLVGTRDSSDKLERKSRELMAADVVICPSQFVYRSLPEPIRRNKRCAVAEFGSPRRLNETTRNTSGKLRVLFAGSMTQRKGLADLFTAIRLLHSSEVELTVMGSPVVPMSFYRGQFQGFHHEPTRPHAEVLALMQQHDVLVLPSIVEGRALVQQEAMSCGLPIIVTANAGGEDLVVEGVTGFLVPIRAPEKLAEKIAWCLGHRSEVAEMGRAARARAAFYTWERYSGKILSVIEQFQGAAHGERPRLAEAMLK